MPIRHYNYRVKPIQRGRPLDGTGIVTVREGGSLLVTNPFASNHNDPNGTMW